MGAAVTEPGPREPDIPAGGEKGAELAPRFLARLVDSFILGLAYLPIALILIFSDVSATVSNIVAAIVFLGYFALMEANKGQTLGKMLLKLKTVAPDGGVPSLEMTLRRNAWYLLGVIPIVGGLLELGAVIFIAYTISQSMMNVGWHDTFAGTRVIPVTV